jgi:transposase InsO family protein
MPWQERSSEGLRSELVALALSGANVSELCRRFEVSRKTAYKWIAREGQGLEDRSRRPLSSPSRTPPAVEEAVLALRAEHPTWGGRKIRARLLAQGKDSPSASTVTGILRRHGLLAAPGEVAAQRPGRFERELPNELWQMDFKGHFATLAGRCHPLTLLDDRSRFCLGAWALPDERGATVRPLLEQAFRRYGLPLAVLCDNGGPWGGRSGFSALEAWLVRLDVRPLHGRPYHPQTQGKLERLHRTMLADALAGRSFRDLGECQEALDAWRDVYNLRRPHEALKMGVPASFYSPSPRSFPASLPEPLAQEGDLVRRVQAGGWVSLLGKEIRIGDGLRGHPVAFRSREEKGVYEIRFCGRILGRVDLDQDPPSVTLVPERV